LSPVAARGKGRRGGGGGSDTSLYSLQKIENETVPPWALEL
jgi:hypothetical protein